MFLVTFPQSLVRTPWLAHIAERFSPNKYTPPYPTGVKGVLYLFGFRHEAPITMPVQKKQNIVTISTIARCMLRICWHRSNVFWPHSATIRIKKSPKRVAYHDSYHYICNCF